MSARVVYDVEAADRLAELGLTVDLIERAIMRAAAEAATCTAFDPPIMAGFMRYGRTVRFLREELVPQGWDYDSPRNFCRTISPNREFAIVSTSGDEATGYPEQTPTNKYPKGYATAQAVDTNGQLGFDFDGLSVEEPPLGDDQLATWFLLYQIDGDVIRAELSLPSAMDEGSISDWEERIILPAFSPNAEPDAERPRDDNDDDDQGGYIVEVNRR
jgi:hypothetical protein